MTCGRMNKKGSLVDLVYFGLILLVLAVFVLIGTKVAGTFQDRIADMPVFQENAPNAITATENTLNNYKYTINSSFIFLTVFLGIVVLVLAALVRVHPIFIPLYIISLAGVIFVSAIFSNIYEKAAQNAVLVDVASSYAAMTAIMHWLPIIIGVFGTILMIVMYKTWSVGN